MEEVQKRDTRIRELVNELASVTADRGEELEDHRALKVRSKELEIKLDSVRAELAEAAEKRSLANDEIKAHKNQLSSLQRSLAQAESRLTEEQQISAEALARVTLLNRQTASLRLQLASMQKALESSESKNKERQVQITSLSKRLNQALAAKVQELARFRSEFFGRLREVLKGRRDIRIVGDRFVFQSGSPVCIRFCGDRFGWAKATCWTVPYVVGHRQPDPTEYKLDSSGRGAHGS